MTAVNVPANAAVGERWVVSAQLFSAFGSGMTAPLLIIYLHSIRGVPLGVATIAGSVGGLSSLLGNPMGGWLADRVGAWRTAVSGLVIAALGTACIGLADKTWQALVAVAAAGFGISISLPSQNSLIGRMPNGRQSRVLAYRYLGLNLGLGAGGLASAIVVDVHSPGSFVTAYMCDGVSFAVAALLLFPLKKEDMSIAGHCKSTGPTVPWVRLLLSDRMFVRICLLQMTFAAVGLGQLRVAFAGWIEYQHASPKLMGLAYLANTAAVAVAQVPALRFSSRRRRTRLLALVCCTWSASWIAVLMSAEFSSVMGWLLAAAAALLAVGEVFLAISLPAVLNEISPDEFRGRYSGLYFLSGTIGVIAAPVVTGIFLDSGHPGFLMAFLAVCAVAAIYPCVRLERTLPAAANLVPSG